jgi:hypothetical protein
MASSMFGFITLMRATRLASLADHFSATTTILPVVTAWPASPSMNCD